MRWLEEVPSDDYPRWGRALAQMPLAFTIETPHGPVGVVHAEPPHSVWSRALELPESGASRAIDIALLGPETDEQQHEARARPVVGLRAPVHGHWPVEEVGTSSNRWNIDTGPGLRHLNRLSLIEVNAAEFRTWTFDVDES